MVDSNATRLDALVILGCRMHEGGRPGPAAQRRASAGIAAWHAHRPSIVIASGGRRWHGVPEADALAALLEKGGVPRSCIVRELCSLSTIENAAYSVELLREARAWRVGVVTCDWHLERSRACFASFGVETLGVPARTPARSALVRVSRGVLERARTWIDRWAGAQWIEQ